MLDHSAELDTVMLSAVKHYYRMGMPGAIFAFPFEASISSTGVS